MSRISQYAVLFSFCLAGCGGNDAKSNDPFRAEFLTACAAQTIYRSKPVNRITQYCACVYDKTLKGLTPEEAMTARFYLLGQSGIDTAARTEFASRDLDAVAPTMAPASAAIGKAVRACGRP